MEDAKTKERIEHCLRKILEESDLDNTTERKIRDQASNELGINLSQPHFIILVNEVVKDFLQEKARHHQQQLEDSEDGDLGLLICELSQKRKVRIQDFKGKRLVSIREYYNKDGKELPSNKGISLTAEQWSSFKESVPDIEKAIKEMESRI